MPLRISRGEINVLKAGGGREEGRWQHSVGRSWWYGVLCPVPMKIRWGPSLDHMVETSVAADLNNRWRSDIVQTRTGSY